MAETAYPLSWPAWQQRTRSRVRAAFKHAGGTLPLDVAIRRLERELELLHADAVILSTSCPRRVDGSLRLDRQVDDPGAAVYFTLRGKRIVLACDKWSRLAENVAAIAAHIESIRGQERWGVGTVEQAFRGYLALPAPTKWREVLDLSESATLDLAERRYRQLARELHPDMTGGDQIAMAELNVAIAEARKELGNGHGV